MDTAGPGTHGERSARRGDHHPRQVQRSARLLPTTYNGGIWAAGWIAAEDRGLLLEQARYNARVAAIDAPGLTRSA